MMKKLLSIATLMLLALMLNAQIPSWTVQNTAFADASRGITWISAPTAQIVWANAYDGVTTTNYIREFTRTTNGGATWSATVIPAGQIPATLGTSNICGIDATTAYMCCFHPTGGLTGIGVYKTTNGGANWVNTSAGTFTNASSFINNCGFWDANNGIAQGDAWGTSNIFEVYTTTDGGTNWLKVPDANLPVGLSAEDGWTQSFFCATFGGQKCAWFGTNKGRIFHTTDGGFNWTVAATPFGDVMGEIAFSDINNGIALCNSQSGYLGTAKTTNGGATWSTAPVSNPLFIGHVAGIPGNPGWFVRTSADQAAPGSQYTRDGGETWTTIDDTQQQLYANFFDIQNGWCGGFNTSPTEGGMFKFVHNGVGIDLKNIADNKLTVYPNPSTGKFRIFNANNSVVNIYDVTGNLVYTTKVNNDNAFAIDFTNQAKGMYIIKVENSKEVKTQKLVIK
jgi:photosystem II stability/assembly factor-like uncharacterized protein